MLKLQIAECSSLLTLPLTSLFIVCQFFPGFSHVALLLYKLIGFHPLPTLHTTPNPAPNSVWRIVLKMRTAWYCFWNLQL